MTADESTRARAWRIFDELVHRAAPGNPWTFEQGRLRYRTDEQLLGALLAVPSALDASTQSGVPALALDVWVAHELRRAGLSADEVWPRASAPRVMTREVAALLASLPKELRSQVADRLARGVRTRDVVAAEAKVLGKNYVKQVDVVMAAWDTGPQVMISTKRMDAALGKNAANRVEESYGDAKNLRLRYPRAALGFVYSLRAGALDAEPDKAAWLIDLLGKLGREDDAYDAVALLLPVIDAAPRQAGRADSGALAIPDDDDRDALADAGLVLADGGTGTPADLPDHDVDAMIAGLPSVDLRRSQVPANLRPERFFEVVIGKALDASPVTFHRAARRLREAAPT